MYIHTYIYIIYIPSTNLKPLARWSSRRPCGPCTPTRRRMRTSWSWLPATSSLRLRWTRAGPARDGSTGPRWPPGCPACCRRTTWASPTSPTPGSFTGPRRFLGGAGGFPSLRQHLILIVYCLVLARPQLPFLLQPRARGQGGI